MSLLHFRRKERRRTIRVALHVLVTVHGKSETGEKFSVPSRSESVNRHGALFHLEELVLLGQTVTVVNDRTTQSADCKVASIHRALDGKQYVGVEFTAPENNFWHMHFPIPGARPLRRAIPREMSA
jgi:hypothetical protein